LSVYLDASVLVALFTKDDLTARADAFLESHVIVVTVSDFAAVEFASAIARRVRTGEMSADAAREVFSTFDAWTARPIQQVQAISADIASAARFLRRLELPLRAGDAMNIAIAQRVGADLLTFDRQMAVGAVALGVTVVVA
jgi:uncharacterized protein